MFGLNTAKYDLVFFKSYLLLILANERDTEITVIKKANPLISFMFGDIQLLAKVNFLFGATFLDSFFKAYKTSETNGLFIYEWFDHTNKMQNTELFPYDNFYSKLRSCNPLETGYTEYVNHLKSGLTPE